MITGGANFSTNRLFQVRSLSSVSSPNGIWNWTEKESCQTCSRLHRQSSSHPIDNISHRAWTNPTPHLAQNRSRSCAPRHYANKPDDSRNWVWIPWDLKYFFYSFRCPLSHLSVCSFQRSAEAERRNITNAIDQTIAPCMETLFHVVVVVGNWGGGGSPAFRDDEPPRTSPTIL